MSSIKKNLELAWRNDSFYMQTNSKKAISIFKAGVAGYWASRVTGAFSPKDSAFFSAVARTSFIFIQFIESRFVKNPLMSEDDKCLENLLREVTKGVLSHVINTKICSLMGIKVLEITWEDINMTTVKFFISKVFIGISMDAITPRFLSNAKQ